MDCAAPTASRIACDLPRLARPDPRAIETALASAGCVVVENVLPPAMLEAVYADLDPWFKRAHAGEGKFFGRRTRRFSGVFAKSRYAAELAACEHILAPIERFLLGPAHAPHGDCIQLSQTQAIEIGPGEPAQLLHRDDGVFPIAKPFEFVVNVNWALDPFTVENGATRLIPGSHLWPRLDIEQDETGIVAAHAPAGSAIIWTGALLHGGGANVSSAPRRGLVLSYSLGWLAQAEKLLLSTPPDIARALPERVQRLIGYQIHRPNLGWVEGRDPHAWLAGSVGALAPAQDNFTPAQNAFMETYLQTIGR